MGVNDGFLMRKHMPSTVDLAKNPWMGSLQALGVNLLKSFC